MARLIVLYGVPADAEAFDRYYRETHVPLVRAIPGLRGFETSQGKVATPPDGVPRHRVAMLSFDSMQALGAALASPQGRAAAADLMYFDSQDA